MLEHMTDRHEIEGGVLDIKRFNPANPDMNPGMVAALECANLRTKASVTGSRKALEEQTAAAAYVQNPRGGGVTSRETPHEATRS